MIAGWRSGSAGESKCCFNGEQVFTSVRQAWLHAPLITARTAPINHRKESFLLLRHDSSFCHPKPPECQVLFFSLCFLFVFTMRLANLDCTTQLQFYHKAHFFETYLYSVECLSSSLLLQRFVPPSLHYSLHAWFMMGEEGRSMKTIDMAREHWLRCCVIPHFCIGSPAE